MRSAFGRTGSALVCALVVAGAVGCGDDGETSEDGSGGASSSSASVASTTTTTSSAATTSTGSGGVVDRVALPSASQLLPGPGTTLDLVATAYDDAGAEVASPNVSWRSDDSDVVSVDAAGRIEAHAIGTTRIHAEIEGVSASLVVWVATVPEGTTLVDDAAVLEGGEPQEDAPLVLGSRYHVAIAGAAPTEGGLVVATQDAPIAGRVVAVETQDDRVDVELEVVGVGELFEDVDFALQGEVALEAPVENHGKFEAAGFECEAETEIEILSELVGVVTEGLHLDHDVRLVGLSREVQHVHAIVNGFVAVDVSGLVALPAELDGKVTCKRVVGRSLRFPIPGALYLLHAKVPLGVGFEIAGSLQATSLAAHVSGQARADVNLGFEWNRDGGFVERSSVEPSHTLRVTWDAPSLEPGGTVKGSAFAFAFADLNVGPPLIDRFDLEVAELRTGIKGEVELAVPAEQAESAELASTYRVAFHGELSAGEHYEKLLERLGVEAETIQLDTPVDVAIFQSPKGTTSADTDEVVAGEPVTIAIELDPQTVDFVEGYNVESVHVWRSDGESWSEVEALDAEEGQTSFEWEWTPTSADEDAEEPITFATTVETTALPGIQLEIAPDSRQQIGEGTSEAPEEMQGRYGMVSWTHTSEFGVVSTFEPPGPPSWEVEVHATHVSIIATRANGLVNVLPYGGEGDPYKFQFGDDTFARVGPGTMTFCQLMSFATTLTITGDVTFDEDGAAELRLTMVDDGIQASDPADPDDPCVLTHYTSTSQFVGTKPAP